MSSARSDSALEASEKALIDADLGSLTAAQRVAFYQQVCQSLGLNSLTKPFEYLRLNGKTILYATKSCTEQLRSIRKVSVELVDKTLVEGVYAVTARATLPDGRKDEAIGAVSLEGLKGENRANALMKSETKAKRRVTLSICGLAYLDESETESVPGAQRVEHDPATGEILERQSPPSKIVTTEVYAAVDPKLAALERFAAHESALAKAVTIDELRIAWDDVCDSGKRQIITLTQKAALNDQKNARKKAIQSEEKARTEASLTEALDQPKPGEADPWDLRPEGP